MLPESWRPVAESVIQATYYPATGLLLVAVLTTLYKLALPHSLPWCRLLPGALLAMVVFIATTTGLRVYIAVLTSSGYTYGALATPDRVPAVRLPARAVDRAGGALQPRAGGRLAVPDARRASAARRSCGPRPSGAPTG